MIKRLAIAASRERKQKEQSRRESFVSEMIKRFAYCIVKCIAEINVMKVSFFLADLLLKAISKGCAYSLLFSLCHPF